MFEEFSHFFQEDVLAKTDKEIPEGLEPVENFPYDKVYHGSHINPRKGSKYIETPKGMLFISPDIGKEIPHCVSNEIYYSNTPTGFYISEIDYDSAIYRRNVDPAYLPTAFSINVYCRGEEKRDEAVTLSPDYYSSIYEIDVSDYKDHIYQIKREDDDDENKDPIYCIAGFKRIRFSKRIRHRIKKIYAKYKSYPDGYFDEGKIERINDKGIEVPEKCDKCGSKVGIYLHGEPVWLCSNKKCKKYFGTVPCNIQESSTPPVSNDVYYQGDRIKIENADFDKVYFGSPHKISNPMKLDRPLFVTPFPGIASIFAVRPQHQDLKKYGVPRGLVVNRGYDEWNRKYVDDILQKPLKEVHVRLEGFPECKPVTEMRHGYIYEIDVSKLKDNLYRSSKMSSLFELCIDGVDSVRFTNVTEIDVKVYVRGEEARV